MSGLVSIDVIKAGLLARLDALVPQLFPNARVDGAEWRVGGLGGEPSQSLAIHRSGGRAGVWADFASGESGDIIALIAATMTNRDNGRAIGWARDWLGLGRLDPAEMRRREQEAERARRQAEAREADEARKRTESAGQMFFAGQALPGTPAERYLIGRGIHLSTLGKAPGALRFHAGIKCWMTGETRPALVAKVQAADGSMQAVHRTLLTIRPDGTVVKAPVGQPAGREAKRSLGKVFGGYIPLWRGASGKSIGHAPDGEPVYISEGIEDGLSVALAKPGARVVAAVSLGNMGNLEFPAPIGAAFICAQNDISVYPWLVRPATGRIPLSHPQAPFFGISYVSVTRKMSKIARKNDDSHPYKKHVSSRLVWV